jgi:hypothetical protein
VSIFSFLCGKFCGGTGKRQQDYTVQKRGKRQKDTIPYRKVEKGRKNNV